eukprot:TRINITY_DN24843_c0_g1_i1.p1 TRINITY_DN24843_c0_g1~~TRINITY_DN24843_c0_g1_i1.p1  ORF type:complete len:597 (+),score=-15.68 TRINITY_DN24843_c0_g1_i1:155-1945(+)
MGATSSSFAICPQYDKELDSSPEVSSTPTDVPPAIDLYTATGTSSTSSIDEATCSTDTASSYCEQPQISDDAEGPSRKRTTIENLPEEVLIKVLAAVNATAESPLDVVLPSMISRRWRRASRDREVLKRTGRYGVSLRARQWCEGAYLFLRRLCENGCLEAAFMLAMILFYCIPGAQFEGGRLLMHSAREGHASSLHAASILSFNGSGLGASHKDVKMGVALCARAAALGHTDAMRELGHCLLDGYGVQQDTQEGWRMLLEAQAAELAPEAYQLSTRSHDDSSRSADSSSGSPRSPFVRQRPYDYFSSAAAAKANNASPFGNAMALGAAEQEGAVQMLLARDWRVAPASPIESASASSDHGAVAAAGDDEMSDDVASAAPVSAPARAAPSPVALVEPAAARKPAAAFSPTSDEDSAGKQALVQKLLMAMASGSFRLTEEHLKSLQPALSVLQTSLRPAPMHPAHVFISEWRQLRGLKSSTADVHTCASPCIGASHAAASAGSACGSAHAVAGTSVCSRATCGRPETRPMEFWRCSTCWQACYCSRSCQLHDWRERHGKECSPVNNGGDAVAAAAMAAATLGVAVAAGAEEQGDNEE